APARAIEAIRLDSRHYTHFGAWHTTCCVPGSAVHDSRTIPRSMMKRPMLTKSSLMATVLAAAIVVWMLTGLAGSGAGPRDEAASGAAAGAKPSTESPMADARPAGLRVTVRK